MKQCEALVEEHGAGKGKTWRNNFRLGLVEAVERILRKDRDTLYRNLRSEATASVDPDRALTRVNDAIAKREQSSDEAHAYAKKTLFLRARSGCGDGGAHDYGARLAGREAGEKNIRIGKAKAGLGSGE